MRKRLPRLARVAATPLAGTDKSGHSYFHQLPHAPEVRKILKTPDPYVVERSARLEDEQISVATHYVLQQDHGGSKLPDRQTPHLELRLRLRRNQKNALPPICGERAYQSQNAI